MRYWDCGYGLKWWILWIVCVWNSNELTYLKGWLRWGKPREMMRLKAYAELWNEKLGNVKLHQMIEMKKMPRKEKYWIEKDAQKGKRMNWKNAQMEKDYVRKMKNGLPIINLLI